MVSKKRFHHIKLQKSQRNENLFASILYLEKQQPLLLGFNRFIKALFFNEHSICLCNTIYENEIMHNFGIIGSNILSWIFQFLHA